MAADRRSTPPKAAPCQALSRLLGLQLGLLLAASLLVASPRAFAGAAEAEALFQAGKEALDEGRYDEACSKFEASHQAEASVGAVLNLALCREKQGRTATAWAKYKEAATLAAELGQPEREAGAKQRASRLERLLSRLGIKVTQPIPGLVVKRNGAEVPAASFGLSIPVDPGKYLVTATAPGHRGFRKIVTVGMQRDEKIIVIPPLEPGRDDPSGPLDEGGLDEGGPDEGGPDEGGGRGPLWAAGWTTLGVGVAGLVVGGVFGGLAIGEKSRLSDCQVNNFCGDQKTYFDDVDALDRTTTISTVGFVAGGVLAAAGLTMILLAPSGDEPEDPAAVALSPALLLPSLSPGGAGITLLGRF